ncbi:DNA polymerase IV [Loigolactobacillus backii]|uniref:DNA polymerase IV n=1 Tax=Loigolactobacillus backii TaxID=375175 RepID=A0A192H2W0_9LACO|nr:DNA polymerase IV [Loigolactobacillus backii]ANK59196.1 DNA polymerase IV [Loigolactobacillus backii]ANK62608.1 DNA polymerase IV [Loigolactobacillus backii]ANK64186.1 DNA polymerase IV [Loigolactobacillus backii]ANK67419.1 DNA polymerase IV [Loigolactobacillus backii]ANK70382.1 DNA polymerase IV [Loigolactobacillus backii]
MATGGLLQIPLENDTSRKIIHVDMDAFYASIEEREHPEFRNQPLIIARNPSDTGGKGVVTTANYVARKFGVHSAMPAAKALALCPKAIFKRPDFTLYRSVSEQVHEIFHRFTDIIEYVSLDEAYLDVTVNKMKQNSAAQLAKMIQQAIFEVTHLTSSTGISYNKFLAKMASDYRKPAGCTVIMPEQALTFLGDLPIEKFHGVGKKTVPKLNDMAIYTGRDLQQIPEMQLIQRFGKMGFQLYRHAHGVDTRPVEYQRERKSIGKEETFGNPLGAEDQVTTELHFLARKVAANLVKLQKHGKTVVLKVRNRNFETTTKRLTSSEYVLDETTIYADAQQLWDEIGDLSEGVRLLGITVTNLDPIGFEELRLPLF